MDTTAYAATERPYGKGANQESSLLEEANLNAKAASEVSTLQEGPDIDKTEGVAETSSGAEDAREAYKKEEETEPKAIEAFSNEETKRADSSPITPTKSVDDAETPEGAIDPNKVLNRERKDKIRREQEKKAQEEKEAAEKLEAARRKKEAEEIIISQLQ